MPTYAFIFQINIRAKIQRINLALARNTFNRISSMESSENYAQ